MGQVVGWQGERFPRESVRGVCELQLELTNIFIEYVQLLLINPGGKNSVVCLSKGSGRLWTSTDLLHTMDTGCCDIKKRRVTPEWGYI
jgi:hypothetical protein